MTWFIVSLSAYLLFALVNVVDKYLLAGSKKKGDYIVYTFFVGALGLIGLILIPFGFSWPGFLSFLLMLASGGLYVFALLFLYKALDLGSASRLLPLIGGGVAFFTFVLSFLFLDERLSARQILALMFLFVGMIVVAWLKKTKDLNKKIVVYLIALASAFLFSSFYTLSYYLFTYNEFINTFIWARIGGFLVVATFLLLPAARKQIFAAKKQETKNKTLFFVNQGMGAAAFLLINWAVSLVSATLVNGLQGVQYAFVLVLTWLAAKKFPEYYKDVYSRRIVLQKVIAVVLIGIGVYLLV